MDIPEPSPVKYSMSKKERSCKAKLTACSNCENDSRKCWKNAHTGPHWSAIYQKSSSLLSLSFSGCIASLPPVILIFSMSLSRWNWLLHRTLSALLWRLRYNTFRSVLWKASCSIWWAMALGDIPTHRGLQSSKSGQSRFSEESSSEDPWKNCPYLKGLPPSHHLIGKSHSITNDDVTCEGCGLFPMELLNATSKI